jgi:hypothetical protein
MQHAGDTKGARAASDTTTTVPKRAPPSRRLLLALAGLSPLAAFPAAAVPTGDPDAELIAVSARWDALELRVRAIGNEAGTGDEAVRAAVAPLETLQEALWGRMIELRATTPGGIAARARSLAIHAGGGDFAMAPNWGTCAGTLVAALMRDSLLMHGLPLPEVLTEERAVLQEPDPVAEEPHADHAFIALCDEHCANLRAFNAYDGTDTEENDRLGRAYDRTRDAIEEAAPPTSFAGAIAKARAVRAEAADGYGSQDLEHRWAMEVIDGLLNHCGMGVS